MSTQEPESVARLQELIERLERARTQLEATEGDPERAVDVLQSLAESKREALRAPERPSESRASQIRRDARCRV